MTLHSLVRSKRPLVTQHKTDTLAIPVQAHHLTQARPTGQERDLGPAESDKVLDALISSTFATFLLEGLHVVEEPRLTKGSLQRRV